MKKILGGCLVGMLVLASAAVGQTRDVTFSVDMSVQIDLGNFNPATMGVDVRGEFNGWGQTPLARVGTSGIYSDVIQVAGAEGAAVAYKFFYYDGTDVWENMADDRTFNLGPAGTPQELDVVYFNNQGPEVTANVKFSVDMAVQIELGNFNPDTMEVEVRGDFNNWEDPPKTVLNREGSTSIYSATISVVAGDGADVGYKFYYHNGAGDVWENDPNRTFVMTADPQVLDVVYFNNQGPVGPEVTANVTFSVNMAVQIELGNFNQSTGVVQIRGPFNGWGGTALTREGETTIYSGTVSVTANEGAEVPHKFYIAGFANPDDGYENAIGDRTFVMAATPQVLDVVYFNDENPPSGLQLAGTWNPATTGDYEFTVTRTDPGIGDVIQLSVDNAQAASVPASVTFGAGLNDATFNVTILSLTDGDVTVTADDAVSGDSAEYTIRMPGLLLDGAAQVYAAGPVTYTLTRFNNIGATVNLQSTNPAVMTVPATASFAGENQDTTFTATAVAEGQTTIVATDPVSGVRAEYNVTFTAAALELAGPVSAWTGTTPTYTLTRRGPIGDTVNLTSSSEAVMTVPATVIFPDAADTVTFQANALTAGETVLNAGNDDAVAGPLNVTVTERPDYVAYDDASLYAGGEWNAAPAHESGFSDWTVTMTPEIEPEGVYRGVFIGTSPIAAINVGGKAFGLYANWSGSEPEPKPEVKVSRSFPAALAVGQSFSVDVGYNHSGGSKGLKLKGEYEGVAYERFELFNSGNDTWSYKLDGNDETITVAWSNYVAGGFRGQVKVTCTAENTYTFSLQRDGEAAVVVADVGLPGAIDQVEFYNYNGGTGDGENFYFNRMWIEGAPAPVGPVIDAITFDVATGNMSFDVPAGYTLVRVEGADCDVDENGAFPWQVLTENVHYTVDGGKVTLLTDAATRLMIRVRLNAN